MIDNEANHDLMARAKETRYIKGEGLYVRVDEPQVYVQPNGISIASGVLILVEPEKGNQWCER